MAIMIPSVISPEVKSSAERKIFEWFQNAPGTDKWIVLHSLGITTHNKVIYSYKPILILALLHYGDRDGCISIENAAVYFREYYSNRKAQGLAIEKKQCIYLRDDVTDAQIIANLLSNPVKALIESGFFFYNEDAHVFSVSPDIWSTIDISNKAAITRICRQKLKDYYKD